MGEMATIQALRKINKGLTEQRNFSDEYYFGQFTKQEEELEGLRIESSLLFEQNKHLQTKLKIATEALEYYAKNKHLTGSASKEGSWLAKRDSYKIADKALKQIKESE